MNHAGASEGNDESMVVFPSSMATLLEDYHNKAATGTSLFVIDIDVHDSVLPETLSKEIITKGVDKRLNYTYSSALFTCSRSTFIGNEGFAWLDLSANADIIMPGEDPYGR